MPIIWIEEATGEIINSGFAQGAEAALLEAEQGLVQAGAASAALIMGAINYLFGSPSQGSDFPTYILYYDNSGNPFTLEFAWQCSWDQGGGTGRGSGL